MSPAATPLLRIPVGVVVERRKATRHGAISSGVASACFPASRK